MGKTYPHLTFPALAFLASIRLLAHSYGPAPRVTAAPGDDSRACTACHAGSALNSGTGSVKILLQSGPVYIPGARQRITVQVSDPVQQRWGFELTARLNSDPTKGQAGDLTPVDNFTQVICEDAGPKPCASGPMFITHTSAGTRNGTKGGATFQVDWTPPTTNAGPVTLYAAGNAANGNGSPVGDLIYTTSIQLEPVVPQAPVVPDGGVVSAATNAAGPVAPNSWMTIYGSNLCAVARGWNDSDFINGGIPFSIEGVSVLLTGAPRLAYVGYVSPTQINFLLPSDLTPGTVQVQVRNAAGISAKIPITVQANAPQLFTVDGKYVMAAHAGSGLVGKSAPASPGENIVLYATGLGPVSPGLITGQLPTQASTLATLPQVTIAGSVANVISAAVAPGSAGLYQITVQVPSNTANGDQQVVVQTGGVNSSPVLLTVQK